MKIEDSCNLLNNWDGDFVVFLVVIYILANNDIIHIKHNRKYKRRS